MCGDRFGTEKGAPLVLSESLNNMGKYSSDGRTDTKEQAKATHSASLRLRLRLGRSAFASRFAIVSSVASRAASERSKKSGRTAHGGGLRREAR